MWEIFGESMLHIISGAPGAGKSSLNAYFLQLAYREEGAELLKRSAARIEEFNKSRLYPLTPPDKPPIYSDFKVKFAIGYKKHFEPYYINGYYMGLANERMRTLFIPPHAKVFLGEAQRYYNSRKSSTFPDFVSRFYEMNRHYGLDVYLDVQRVRLIDANIREICRHFIEVQSMEHERDELQRIVRSTWHCREFDNWLDFEDYLNTGAVTYKETEYTYEGNIFELYDSFGFAENYLPKDEAGNDISYLNHMAPSEVMAKGDDVAEFYRSGEPAGYRSASEANKKKKGDKNEGQDGQTA